MGSAAGYPAAPPAPRPPRTRPPIICLGPNKTGTKAIDQLFRKSGVKSVSMGGPFRSRNLALSMLRNVSAARPVLCGFEHVEAFSDISYLDTRVSIDVSALMPFLVSEHPDAYFIYNDRDMDRWLRSRSRHFGGDFARRFRKCYNVTEDEMITIWQCYFEAHRARTFAAVGRVGGKLLHFTLGQDVPERIVEFVRPHYELDSQHWSLQNASRPRVPWKTRVRTWQARYRW